MSNVLISAIVVSDRQRSAIDDTKLAELEQSIEQKGLFHPIVIDSEGRLLAGGRRLAAVTNIHNRGGTVWHGTEPIPPGHIPAVTIDATDELAKQEVELDENLIRENLSWQDETRALAKIHSLRKLNNPAQTFAETSKEVLAKTNSPQSPKALADKISRATITEQFLDREEVKQAGNEKLAFNAAMRIARNEFANELAKRKKGSNSLHQFTCGDARVEIGKLSRTFRCFILDPPYGIAADKFGSAADGRHSYDDDKASALRLNWSLIGACSKIATPDAHMWLFCDVDNIGFLKESLQQSGFTPFRTPLVWNSGTSGHVPNQKTAIRRNYELILFASRSDRGLAQMLDDVIRINSKGSNEHGAAKPTELYELFIKLSCSPGDYVLDPTCGSGTIFRAASKTSCIAYGIELDEQHAQNCQSLLIELEREKERKGE